MDNVCVTLFGLCSTWARLHIPKDFIEFRLVGSPFEEMLEHHLERPNPVMLSWNKFGLQRVVMERFLVNRKTVFLLNERRPIRE
jgi:hypothetical protein